MKDQENEEILVRLQCREIVFLKVRIFNDLGG